MKKILRLGLGVLLVMGCKNSSIETGKDWPAYGGNKAGNRYSPLNQINTGNVRICR